MGWKEREIKVGGMLLRIVLSEKRERLIKSM